MKKLAVLSFTLILTGCGSVPHITEVAITSVMQEMPLADEVIVPSPVAAMPTPAPPVISELGVKAIESIPAPAAIPSIEQHKIAKKMTALIGKVMSAAEAATESKKEIVTYDATGLIASKVIEVNQASTAERLAQLLALLTGTLGLYVGVKKFRHPT